MNRRDAETQRRSREKHPFLILLSLCLCVSAVSFSCGSKPTDMRTLAPADSLVYLETNDLAAALQPIVDSKPFNEVAKRKPDFSALKGVQLAVAITGFEASEEKLTDEHSVGKIQPHFVAIADTHAYQFQAVRFAEEKLGGFVAEMYDSEPTLEKTEKGGGHKLVWTAKDGRKAYAVVARSLIYFGNDDSAIEKCLAVERGEADSIVKTGKVPPADPATLASGYVSTDGVAQIANIFALKFAQDASDESEVQSAIAGILPQLLRNTITDVTWTATKTDQGYEDKWQVNMPSELASVFYETLTPSGDLISQQESRARVVAQLPNDISSATRYNFKDPQIAWRSVVLTANQRLDALGGKMIGILLNSAFDQYGIKDPETFLKSLGDGKDGTKNVITSKLSPDSDGRVLLAWSGDQELTRKSFGEIMDVRVGEGGTFTDWRTKDKAIVSVQDGLLTIRQPFDRALKFGGGNPEDFPGQLLRTSAPVATVDRDDDSIAAIVDLVSEKKTDDARVQTTYFTETRFNKTGMERKTTSDFGFIGWIIAQLAEE